MDRLLTESRSCDRAVVISLIVPAVLLPVSAHAMQVGCFFTAMFLGMMFLVCLGITELSKYCICKYLWKVRTWIPRSLATSLELSRVAGDRVLPDKIMHRLQLD